MPSSIGSGAVYGIGVYGTSVYNVASVTVLVDGVQGTTVLNDTLQIQADANHVICTLCLGAMQSFVGSVVVKAGAKPILTGVEATGFIGTVSQVTVNRVPVTGVVGTSELGTLSLETNNYLDVIGVEGTGVIRVPAVLCSANVSLSGVFATASANATLTILENEVVVPPSSPLIINAGTVLVTTTAFNFNAVASQYDRNRTVYIHRRTTSKERTVIVPAN
jgi:hypothetical protein